MLDFETWQEWECARLCITVDEHSKILELSNKIQAAGLGCPYDFITNIIRPTTILSDFAVAVQQVAVTNHISPQNPKHLRQRMYKSKKSRRSLGNGR